MATYLDASAVVKLVLDEPETSALEGYLASVESSVSCELLPVEVVRAARRRGPETVSQAHRVLEQVTILELDQLILERAGLLDPPETRSLDAIHVAAALSLGAEVEAIVTYDTRMRDAARAAGLRVAHPGQPAD